MNRIRSVLVALAISWGIVGVSSAGVHRWDIGEIFSNDDGTIQFIELFETIGDPSEWFFNSNDASLTMTSGDSQVFFFPSDLDTGTSTALARALLGTAGFADVSGVTPDWIIPDGFIPLGGGTATLGSPGFGNFEVLNFGSLLGGLNSLNFDAAGNPTIAFNSPTNFAGETGAVPEPSTAAMVALGLLALASWRRACRSACSYLPSAQ